MSISIQERNKSIKNVLNGTYTAIQTVVPIKHEISKPEILENYLEIQYGALIGITGDIKGKLILAGAPTVFALIGETMFGMALEGEMLTSFSGELGNMIAGGLSTNIVSQGINMDITSPTIIQGNTKLSGYEKALHVSVEFEKAGLMEIYLLVD
ncbi:chemotaxis protein CheX [Virgibacillus sp. L01]|uniref:chemotaxis protein CheX n=1 Tax=Virgibacillus sp. L01 TaxID=3457429 RepID=UPI003FD16E14